MHLAKKLAGILFFGCVMLTGTVHGQTRLFTSYTKADGLPSDYVMRIYQSPGGLMWFGTERGAASYDGERFTRYTTEDGLPHNLVFDFLEDQQGRTWFATQSSSLSYLNYGSIHTFLDSTGTISPLNSICMDRNGRVMFRFHDGIGILNGNDYRFHNIRFPVSKESNMARLLDGRVIFSDSRHVLVSRLDSGTDLRFDTLLVFDHYNNYSNIRQASDSTIYISHTPAMGRYRLGEHQLELIETIPTPFSTTMNVISESESHRVLLGSRIDGLWMAHNGLTSRIATSQGSDLSHISAQLVDYEGNLWVAHFGQGVQKITSWNAMVFDQESGILERNVWRVATHGRRIYAMSVAGLQVIQKQTSEYDVSTVTRYRTVRGIQFSSDRVYIGTMSAVYIHEYDPLNDHIGERLDIFEVGDGVNDIHLAKDGTLWIAAAGMNLFRRLLDGTIESYPVQNGVERLVGAGEAVWWLTSDDGAFRYHEGSIVHYSRQTRHLPSNTVWSLHEDGNGILIGTSAGLVRISDQDSVTTYNSSNGLIGSEVIGIFPTAATTPTSPSYWIVTRNHIHQWIDRELIATTSLAPLSNEMAGAHWLIPSRDLTSMILATSSGVLIYDLTQSGRKIPPPKVALQSVWINSVAADIYSHEPTQVRASSSVLDVSFNGLTFIKERDTRFTYRLVGLDDTWSEPQLSRNVRYANIPPGNYEFQVKAVNVDGIESVEPALIRIRIIPPLWMHPLFVMVIFFVIVAIGTIGIRWKLNAMRLEIIKRNEQKQFEAIQRIGASISHDIKNTVFSLNLLARNLEKRFDNPEFRKDAIETIESSLTYLSTLVSRLQKQPTGLSVHRTEVNLYEMAQAIQKRLSVISERAITVDIPTGYSINTDAEILERILENLIQNAIDATTPSESIVVSARRVESEHIICVRDSGKGMSREFIQDQLFKPFQSTKTKGIGIGLFTCKELIEVLQGTIEVESEPGKGTTFCVRFVS